MARSGLNAAPASKRFELGREGFEADGEVADRRRVSREGKVDVDQDGALAREDLERRAARARDVAGSVGPLGRVDPDPQATHTTSEGGDE